MDSNLDFYLRVVLVVWFGAWLLAPLASYFLKKKNVYMAVFYLLFFVPVIIMVGVEKLKQLKL